MLKVVEMRGYDSREEAVVLESVDHGVHWETIDSHVTANQHMIAMIPETVMTLLIHMEDS